MQREPTGLPHLTSLLDPSKSRKCEHFHLHCQSGFDAEEWYENFEQNTPSVITSWRTLCKHFCIKWVGPSTNILLKIVKEKPVTSIQLCTATITLHEINTPPPSPFPHLIIQLSMPSTRRQCQNNLIM